MLAVGAVAVLALTAAPAASAQEVQTWICSGPASLSLESPRSDSIQAGNDVVLSGKVTQSNQIQVNVNGQPNSTIPLVFAATTYSATIHVPNGTHEVAVTAIDSCQIGDATATAVVTIQPRVTPTAGADTDTSTSGVIIGAPLQADQASAPKDLWKHSIVAPFMQIGRFLNLYDPVESTTGSTPQLARFGLVLFGASMILLSMTISRWDPVRKWLNACSDAMGMRSIHAHRIIITMIGGFVIWLAFLV